MATITSDAHARHAESLIQDLHRFRTTAGTASTGRHRKQSVAFSPPCRLRLEGDDLAEATCEILELSAEGVNIAILGGRPVHRGQQGRLLIGPPEGDHYELPVGVTWVEPAATIAVLGLSLDSPPHWRLSRT